MKVCSLFCGIGGIDIGFKQAGYDIVWANEYDAAACKTYRHNFGDSYLVEADIRKVSVADIPDFDVLTAGFPCQPFSIAGRQRGFEDNEEIYSLKLHVLLMQNAQRLFYLKMSQTLWNTMKVEHFL